jgi:hypothetical protein
MGFIKASLKVSQMELFELTTDDSFPSSVVVSTGQQIMCSVSLIMSCDNPSSLFYLEHVIDQEKD